MGKIDIQNKPSRVQRRVFVISGTIPPGDSKIFRLISLLPGERKYKVGPLESIY